MGAVLHLYSAAESFKVERQKLLNLSSESSLESIILPHCSLNIKDDLGIVKVMLETNRMIIPQNVAKALKFRTEDPTHFSIFFQSIAQVKKDVAQDFLNTVKVSVMPSRQYINQLEGSVPEIIKKAMKHNHCRMLPYGPCVLIPGYVKAFFKNCYVRPDGSIGVSGHKVVESDNIFIRLTISLGCWLMSLNKWCVICRESLPPFSRLWSCDEEQCLYRVEELGSGATILQELNNSELTYLEIALAAAATRCKDRDVFEPYPSFLLKQRQVRRRSGLFSNMSSGSKDISNAIKSREYLSKKGNFLSNKKLDLLKKVIYTFPPLEEMQQCSNEAELIVKLGTSWIKQLTGSDSMDQTKLTEEGYAENMWLPYKIFRYILCTNRLWLYLVDEVDRFNGDTLHQFAVFYNDEKELKFAARRKAEGSIFTFHGSHISNWYSILRNGLKCFIKTAQKKQQRGVCLTTDMNRALGFSNNSLGNLRTKVLGKKNQFSVIALCEVLSGEKYYEGNNSDLVVPCEKENDVIMRYLMVYDMNMVHAAKIINSAERNKKITEGNMLSKHINLSKHYENVRSKSSEKLFNGALPTQYLQAARRF